MTMCPVQFRLLVFIMPIAAIFLLSISMSVDAFAVAVGRGTTLNRARIGQALHTGVIFGVVEAITPFLGWSAGIAANDWVAHFDHWLAFLLLAAVGLHMIYGAFHGDEGDRSQIGTSFPVLVATALGTSLDAMAVGLSLAFIGVDLAGIVLISIAIGFATFMMSTAGILLGGVIGARFGKLAEVAAGIVLLGIGTTILWEHLSAA